MNAPVYQRTIFKAVAVTVDIEGGDLLKSFSNDELKTACRNRGIKLKEDSAGRKFKIMQSDMLDVMDFHRRGDIEGMLIALERILPSSMRHLSQDVERFYRKRA